MMDELVIGAIVIGAGLPLLVILWLTAWACAPHRPSLREEAEAIHEARARQALALLHEFYEDRDYRPDLIVRASRILKGNPDA